jgi:hypothetical protein
MYPFKTEKEGSFGGFESTNARFRSIPNHQDFENLGGLY